MSIFLRELWFSGFQTESISRYNAFSRDYSICDNAEHECGCFVDATRYCAARRAKWTLMFGCLSMFLGTLFLVVYINFEVTFSQHQPLWRAGELPVQC